MAEKHSETTSKYTSPGAVLDVRSLFLIIQEQCILKNVLFGFSVNFEYLFENFKLNMTLKIHIILHHYKDYFDMTQKSMRFTNGEFVESSHYSFKKEERTHGFKVKRAIGTPEHLEKSLKSLVWHNSKRAGFTPPSKLQLRKYSPYSSPYSSPFSGR